MHITACRYAVQCQPCFTPAYFTLSTSACHISSHMAPAQMSPCFASQNHLTQTYNLPSNAYTSFVGHILHPKNLLPHALLPLSLTVTFQSTHAFTHHV